MAENKDGMEKSEQPSSRRLAMEELPVESACDAHNFFMKGAACPDKKNSSKIKRPVNSKKLVYAGKK